MRSVLSVVVLAVSLAACSESDVATVPSVVPSSAPVAAAPASPAPPVAPTPAPPPKAQQEVTGMPARSPYRLKNISHVRATVFAAVFEGWAIEDQVLHGEPQRIELAPGEEVTVHYDLPKCFQVDVSYSRRTDPFYATGDLIASDRSDKDCGNTKRTPPPSCEVANPASWSLESSSITFHHAESGVRATATVLVRTGDYVVELWADDGNKLWLKDTGRSEAPCGQETQRITVGYESPNLHTNTKRFFLKVFRFGVLVDTIELVRQ